MKRILILTVLLGLLGGGTCTPPAPTFSDLKTNVFEPRCGNTAGCHAENPARGLDLKVDPYSALLGVSSQADPSKKYVVAGDPDNSLLLIILQANIDNDDPALSARQMPPGFSLPAETVEGVEAWIAAGALDD